MPQLPFSVVLQRPASALLMQPFLAILCETCAASYEVWKNSPPLLPRDVVSALDGGQLHCLYGDVFAFV
jgi:hypothetical protein